jgi:hypothetical protein
MNDIQQKLLEKISFIRWQIYSIVVASMVLSSIVSISFQKKRELRNKQLTIKEQCQEKTNLYISQASGYLSSRLPITESPLFIKTECKDLYNANVKHFEEKVMKTMDSDSEFKLKIEVLKKELETQKLVEKRMKIFLDQYFIEKLKSKS